MGIKSIIPDSYQTVAAALILVYCSYYITVSQSSLTDWCKSRTSQQNAELVVENLGEISQPSDTQNYTCLGQLRLQPCLTGKSNTTEQ